jgi:UDP-apiose/xylose synthase
MSFHCETSKENPARANGHIFNVGNPNNEVTVRELAEMMTEVCTDTTASQLQLTLLVNVLRQLCSLAQVYSNVSGEPPLDEPMIDVSSNQFYGEGYDDSDKRIPDMSIINRQLGMAVFSNVLSFAVVLHEFRPLIECMLITVGWNPNTPLKDLLQTTLTYQHKTYKEAIKRQMSQASASS